MIDLRGVVSASGGFPVLAGVDLKVVRGETLVVSGSNGAGKTSLLRFVAGLLPLSAGDARVLGCDLAVDRRSHRHRLAFVGADTFCYDDLSIRSNLSLHARLTGAGGDQLGLVVDTLGLGTLMDVAHGRLSTGQRRRCALAVAMLRRVDLMLLDEPHSGLDASTRDVVDEALRVASQGGATILLASHELDRANDLADRQVVVEGGCVVS